MSSALWSNKACQNVAVVMSAVRNISGAFAVFLDFKFVTVSKKSTDYKSISNVPFHISRNTHCKVALYLSNRFAVGRNRCLVNCEMSYFLP